jgi:hypothetical protein
VKLFERWRNRRTWPHYMDGHPVHGEAHEGGTGVWDVHSTCEHPNGEACIQRVDAAPVAGVAPSLHPCVACAASCPAWSTYEVERRINHCIAHGVHMPCGKCEALRTQAMLAQQAPSKDPRVEAQEMANERPLTRLEWESMSAHEQVMRLYEAHRYTAANRGPVGNEVLV